VGPSWQRITVDLGSRLRAARVSGPIKTPHAATEGSYLGCRGAPCPLFPPGMFALSSSGGRMIARERTGGPSAAALKFASAAASTLHPPHTLASLECQASIQSVLSKSIKPICLTLCICTRSISIEPALSVALLFNTKFPFARVWHSSHLLRTRLDPRHHHQVNLDSINHITSCRQIRQVQTFPHCRRALLHLCFDLPSRALALVDAHHHVWDSPSHLL
jgi:hypothetical protein